MVDSGGKEQSWDAMRTINLPIYTNSENIDLGLLKLVIRYWKEIQISEDIPCLALAVKCHGNYSDIREAKCISVLLVWNDEVCRIVTLDWFEGPEEDCITPEWYVNTTPLLSLKETFERIEEFTKKSQLENPIYSIFTLPLCLGCALKGEIYEGAWGLWGNEWKYSDHSEFIDDLDIIFSRIRNVFSN